MRQISASFILLRGNAELVCYVSRKPHVCVETGREESDRWYLFQDRLSSSVVSHCQHFLNIHTHKHTRTHARRHAHAHFLSVSLY